MAKPKEYYSEEVAIPVEAFKKFFNNFNMEKRLLLLVLKGSILLIAASITALVKHTIFTNKKYFSASLDQKLNQKILSLLLL